MYNVPESECFTAKYRALLRGEEIKLFTPNDSISLYSQVNFDNQSLLDYFAVSILGGILSSVKAHFAQQRADIVEMEGKIWLNLANPLTLLGVRGYSEQPVINDGKIKIFISSDLTDETFTQLTQNALRYCFIYCSRPQILRNITVKSEKSEILTDSHFKRLKFVKFEKQKRPLNHH
ncbi:peroxiredoxin [Haemophilus influenzae]